MFEWRCKRCGEVKRSDYPYKEDYILRCSRCEDWFVNPNYEPQPLRKDERWWGEWTLEKHDDGWYCCDHVESLGEY